MNWDELLTNIALIKWALPLLIIGLLVKFLNNFSKNGVAKTIFDAETINAIKKDEGVNFIREQSKIATNDTFKRAFDKMENMEKIQQCHEKSINNLDTCVARIDINLEYIKKFVENHDKQK